MKFAWLAFGCVAGFIAVVSMRTGEITVSVPVHVSSSADQITTETETSSAQDTLTRTDKFAVPSSGYVIRASQISPATDGRIVGASNNPEKVKTVNHHQHDADAGKPAVKPVNRQAKSKVPSQRTIVAHNKTAAEIKSCRRPNGFAGFLRLLNLGPECEA
jgi:hypothetical protein